MNKNIKLIIVFLVFLGIGVAVSMVVLTKTVTVVDPVIGKAVDAIYATGTVEPTIMVPIAPRVSSNIMELSVQEGQSVQKGDVLARLEDSEQQAAITDLTAKMSFAEKDLNRKQQLLKTQSVSRDIVDSAQANLDSLKAQLEKVKIQASYLTLIAPADGLIIRKDGEIGELIAAGQPVFYMSCCAPLRITAEVDEEDIPKVAMGQTVLIQSDAFPDKVYQGKIIGITPKGDSVSRSYRVRIGFDTNDHPFMIGMTVETNIVIQKIDDAILIPLQAIGQNKTVQRVQGNVVQFTKVETGIQNANSIQILSGLSRTDKVIMPYDESLENGKKIRTKTYQEGAK